MHKAALAGRRCNCSSCAEQWSYWGVRKQMDFMWFSSFQTVPTHEPLCNGPRTQDYTSMGGHEGKTLQYFQPSSSEMRQRTHLILKLFENTETYTWCLKIQCSENGGVRFCTVGCSVCTLLLCQSEMQKKKRLLYTAWKSLLYLFKWLWERFQRNKKLYLRAALQ